MEMSYIVPLVGFNVAIAIFLYAALANEIGHLRERHSALREAETIRPPTTTVRAGCDAMRDPGRGPDNRAHSARGGGRA